MKSIKKRDLEIKLEDVPPHSDPKAELEQYSTPATIAADILFDSLLSGDIYGERVADLGCGTGIFAIGAAYLGADVVHAVDIDQGAIDEAIETAEGWGVRDRIEFSCMDVEGFQQEVDTVMMNPPFGSQKKGADTPFLEKAFQIADRVYSLHNARTIEFLERFIREHDFEVRREKRYKFEIDNIYEFHTKTKKEFEVVLFVLEKER